MVLLQTTLVLLDLLKTQPQVANLAEAGLFCADVSQLKDFWTSGCLTWLFHKLKAAEEDTSATRRSLQTMVRGLEVECNQEPYVQSHGTDVLLSILKGGPEALDRLLACQGLRALQLHVSPSDRVSIVQLILASDLVTQLENFSQEHQLVVLEMLAEWGGASEESRSLILTGDTLAVISRVGLQGDIHLQVHMPFCCHCSWHSSCACSLLNLNSHHRRSLIVA